MPPTCPEHTRVVSQQLDTEPRRSGPLPAERGSLKVVVCQEVHGHGDRPGSCPHPVTSLSPGLYGMVEEMNVSGVSDVDKYVHPGVVQFISRPCCMSIHMAKKSDCSPVRNRNAANSGATGWMGPMKIR